MTRSPKEALAATCFSCEHSHNCSSEQVGGMAVDMEITTCQLMRFGDLP